MEGKERMATVAYAAEHQAGTAICLRLCQPWRHTGRTVVADSAFASVRTLIAEKHFMDYFSLAL
jgi:hypothetical protein